MTIRVEMPSGADERVNPQAVLVLRNATPSERKENPEVRTTIWLGAIKIYPAEDLESLAEKFKAIIKLADLTAPNGARVLVNMASVADADDPGDMEAKQTRTVLFFGSGDKAPRQAVREARPEIREMWREAGLPDDPFA